MERQDELNLERKIQEAKQRATAPIWAMMMKGSLTKAFGGGEAAEMMADLIAKVQYGMPPFNLTPPFDLYGGIPADSIKPDQSESNQIQPDEAQAS